jgi:hypothetical protein
MFVLVGYQARKAVRAVQVRWAVRCLISNPDQWRIVDVQELVQAEMRERKHIGSLEQRAALVNEL